MEVACFKIRLNPGSIPLIHEWSARLNAEMPELKKLLSNEGMTLESVFLEQGADGDFLIYYLRSPNLKRTREISEASEHPIDLFHRRVMNQVSAGRVKLECLLDASCE